MSSWVALAVATALTLLLRAGPSLVRADLTLPPVAERAQRFVTPAVLGALASRAVTTEVASAPRAGLVATVVGVAVAARTRSVVATVAAGTLAWLAVGWAIG